MQAGLRFGLLGSKLLLLELAVGRTDSRLAMLFGGGAAASMEEGRVGRVLTFVVQGPIPLR